MTRNATIRTTHADAALVAAALRPDNTDEMETRVEPATDGDVDGERVGTVVTRIERETTGGLHSTVDDYVVNLDVATAVVAHANDVPRARNDTDADQANSTDVTASTTDTNNHE